jgi:predicted RNA binding protein YcfA (HicA-like mRNA interferase family)
MTKVPSLHYDQVIRALQRDGWVVVRQKGSHVRLQKHTPAETLKLSIPAHRPLKRSTLAHILKQAKLTVEELDKLLWTSQQIVAADGW